MRFAAAFVAGVVTALALFLMMQSLIASRSGPSLAHGDGQLIDFIRVAPDETTRAKKRQKPVRPPPPRPPPPLPRVQVARLDRPPPQPLNIEPPPVAVAPSTVGGPYLGVFNPPDPAVAGDMIPIVRIQPQYPRAALIEGVEGWVDVEFTIDEDGTVVDATVTGAQPRGMFERAALRAILRWKFSPRVVDGTAVRRRASQRIEFLLEGQ